MITYDDFYLTITNDGNFYREYLQDIIMRFCKNTNTVDRESLENAIEHAIHAYTNNSNTWYYKNENTDNHVARAVDEMARYHIAEHELGNY